MRVAYSPSELAYIEARQDMPRIEIHAGFVAKFGRPDVLVDHIKNLCTRSGWVTRAARRPIPFSAEEIAFVRDNRLLSRKTLHEAFSQRFDRPDVKPKDLQALCTRRGWTTRSNGPTVIWSAAEIAFVEANQTLPRRDLFASVVLEFGRDDLTEDHVKSLCARKGFSTGRTGRLEPGNVPANKGVRCADGVGGRSPRARRSQFKKGQVPHNSYGAGHERIDKEGYVWLIIDGLNPWTGAATRPVLKHRYLWEQANGPIPPDHALKCLDGDRGNTDPSNWELIHRGVLSRLNAARYRKTLSYGEAPAELKPIVMAAAKLKHATSAARRRRKNVEAEVAA